MSTVADGSIVIVDGHEMFATALRVTLCSHGLVTFQAPIASRDGVLDYVREVRPRVAVLDPHLGLDAAGNLIDGVNLVAPLRRLGCAVLVVSGFPDQPREAAAIAAGAVGLIPKTSSVTLLLAAIHAARSGDCVMSEHTRRAWVRIHDQHEVHQRDRARVLGRLSPREREVLDLLAQGHRAAAVAEHFVVSMTTVRTQIAAILTTLDVTSQLAAVALVTTRELPPWDMDLVI